MQQWECKTTHMIPSTEDTLYDFETKALNLEPGEASKGEVENHAVRLRSGKGCRRQIPNHCTLDLGEILASFTRRREGSVSSRRGKERAACHMILTKTQRRSGCTAELPTKFWNYPLQIMDSMWSMVLRTC
jgi:hypothetical protein